MDPVLRAILLSWDWRLSVIAVLLLTGGGYTLGWWRLRRLQGELRRGRRYLANGWRLASYLGGLAILGVALMSPIDALGSQLFSMHMVQHLLLVMFSPPLLLLANPLPFLLWGLPASLRRRLGLLLSRASPVRRALRAATRPGLSWLIFVAVYLGWHDPNAYNLALRIDWVHDLEHITFFGTAMLLWWHITLAGPRIHGRFSYGARIAYVLITIPVNLIAGAAIAFSSQPVYTYYTTVPRLWGLTVMQDQMVGGVIMWVPGSMMFIVAALILVARLLQIEEAKPPLPEAEWATDEAMIVPGWKE
ncbi:MAG: cytochrome c oxidase assembly protein [Anaerolineae bacterium]